MGCEDENGKGSGIAIMVQKASYASLAALLGTLME